MKSSRAKEPTDLNGTLEDYELDEEEAKNGDAARDQPRDRKRRRKSRQAG